MVNRGRYEVKMKEKILIVGGKGFIGSHLIEKLIENYEVYSMDNSFPQFGNHILPKECHQINGDVRRYEDVEFAIKNIDYVVHLAALSHVSTCLNDPKMAFDVNVGGTVNILDACRKLGMVKRIVVAASDHIFGQNPHLPVSENNRLDAITEWDVYGKTKAFQAVISKMYYDLYDLPVVVTASGNVYSSRQSKPNMIPNFIDAALKNKPLYIHGDGKQTRDVYHVDDLIRGYIKCIETKNIDGELFNFGSGHETSINEIANKILELTESKSDIIYTKDTSLNAMNRMLLYINKAKLYLDWEPIIDLETGLKQTIKNYKNNIK